jgi:hypothetical protein
VKTAVTLAATWLALALAGAAFAAEYEVGDRLAPPTEQEADTTEIVWDDLMPEDWDPLEAFRDLDLYALEDSDPRAIAALERIREIWQDAPVNEALDGRSGRIAGFLVPLDWDAREFREFLLVPYFGACIHTPPPPANQVIHVVADPPVHGMEIMEAVWVEGRLEVASSDTDMGRSGYRMQAHRVTLYEW